MPAKKDLFLRIVHGRGGEGGPDLKKEGGKSNHNTGGGRPENKESFTPAANGRKRATKKKREKEHYVSESLMFSQGGRIDTEKIIIQREKAFSPVRVI